MAYTAYRNRNADIYMLDTETQVRRRLTDHLGEDTSPAWSPDGKWIAFISNRRVSYEIYRISPKGGDPRLLARLLRGRNSFAPAWSPDGQWIAFFSVSQQEGNRDPRIYVVSADGK
jgi:TolB protein